MAHLSRFGSEPFEFDFSEYPDFLHSTYEVTWVDSPKRRPRSRHKNVIFTRPELTGFQKCVIDVGFGAKGGFQYLDDLTRNGPHRPDGTHERTAAQPEHLIQLCRLRAGKP